MGGLHLKKNQPIKIITSFGVAMLFFILTAIPMTIGYNYKYNEQLTSSGKYSFSQNHFSKYYTRYHASEIPNYQSSNTIKESIYSPNVEKILVGDAVQSLYSLNDSLNSSWPMYCHDVRHTGQSPYSTANTTGVEKWRMSLVGWVEGSPVIDKNGIVYIGGGGFFAFFPNGIIKWNTSYLHIDSAPAIDENGTIYVGTIYAMPNYFYAFYPNGTTKWKYVTGDSIHSSPVIGNDGTIFFGQNSGDTGYINALYSNGTLRWRYHTSGVVLSSPAIGNDGTIYCGSHDGNLYALYPNNGTVKWKFSTGGWVRTAPCISGDGTIYCVSLDNYLYAVYSNGTMKWRTNVGAGTSPTIGQDGTIYAGWDHLYAVNPTNGSVKWIFNPGSYRCIEGGTPAHSIDGTIYCGAIIRIGTNSQGGEIIAINPNGTEKWRITIADFEVRSAPAIADDGTVYIGSCSDLGDNSYLHAFGPLDPNAPDAPTITGQTNGRIKKTYDYTFTTSSPLGKQIYYLIEWGDRTTTDWLGPYNSDESLTMEHSWSTKGTYIITARAKDTDNLWGPWGNLSVTMPYEPPQFRFIEWLLERFPNAFPLLRYLIEFV
jgi:outer membrane protein assembly factor BamB